MLFLVMNRRASANWGGTHSFVSGRALHWVSEAENVVDTAAGYASLP